jgi:hypothetical protein
MRWMLASAAVAYAAVIGLLAAALTIAALALGPSAANAGAAGPGPGVTANDSGGIIQWAPGMGRSFYREIAAEHCARYGRYAGISSVRHSYGNYIGFQCVYDRRYDPRRLGLSPED